MIRRLIFAGAVGAAGLVTAGCDGFAFSESTRNLCNEVGWSHPNCIIFKCLDWWHIYPGVGDCPFN